jgi:hypothetical protein
MDITLEKEKIKKEIDLIDDPRVIKAIKKLLADQEGEDTPPTMVSEPPIEDWEMALPTGRTPTPAQLDEWMKKDEGETMSGEEAFEYIRKKSAARKANKNK